MLTLWNYPVQNHQMDWSLDPKEEIKSEPDEDEEDIPSTNAENAVTRHFERSLQRMSQFQNRPLSNGPNAFVPYMRFDNLPPAPPQEFDDPRKIPQGNNHQQSSPQPQAMDYTSRTPHDVEAIASILRTYQLNRFINSSILQQDIKDEPFESTETNGNGTLSGNNSPSYFKNGRSPNNFKREATPPLVAVSTDFDIEAELPCTSIKQRPKKRTPAKPRKKATTNAAENPPKAKKRGKVLKQGAVIPAENSIFTPDVVNKTEDAAQLIKKEIVGPTTKPVKVLKQGTKRTTKRKTNYRETSSDDEPPKVKNSRSRSTSNSKTKRRGETALPVIQEIKDEPTEPKQNLTEIKEKTTEIKEETSEIKEETIEIKEDQNKVKEIERKIESFLEVNKEVGANAAPEISDEIKTEPNGETNTEIKTDSLIENGAECAIDMRAEPNLDIKMELDEVIKTELSSQTASGTINEEIKEEVKDEIKNEPLSPKSMAAVEAMIKDIQLEIKDGPSTSNANVVVNPAAAVAAQKKPKRVRNPATAAATARNRTRLHPLTRKEQMIMNKLMESKEPFLQNIPCLKLSSKISKCRECRCASLRSDSVFCRFFEFRRLRFKENGVLLVDGFSDPHKDPGPADLNLWMPVVPPTDIDLDTTRYILKHVGDQFCRIWQEEQKAIEEHISPNKTIAWKKTVKGVREICDVCEATLFNFHWTCVKCGFGVCLDCYKDRKRNRKYTIEKPGKGFDDFNWLVCSFREPHEPNKLMLTQIIPGNSLNFMAHRLHQVCKLWQIPQKCGCPLYESIKEESFQEDFRKLTDNTIKEAYLRFYTNECEIKYLTIIKDLNPQNEDHKMARMSAETRLIEEASSAGTLPSVLSSTLKHLKLRARPSTSVRDDLKDPISKEYNEIKSGNKVNREMWERFMTSRTSNSMFPGIEHDWLNCGKLLRLLDSRNGRNALLFQQQWNRGQPVMASELSRFLNIGLWHPEAFCRDFGEQTNDLINCMTGNIVPNQPMKLFWEGFQCVSKRLLDTNGEPMLLKLKDWPPGDDFTEILPTRYKDLMSALPLPEYTLRTGCLNIASRLPNIFVPPDLGPKMYNAYGSALHPDKATTNLHLDISDAVNIMVYVGIPTDASSKDQIKAAMRAIDGGGCDISTRRRVRSEGILPGALWHIYLARDADKIRDLLNRVTVERGFRLEPDHDPIHDQSWYLDSKLRERLYVEYGVEGYPIVQCLGDAIFIPAGAPHQVRNLHNCIKVAEDFVSPENIEHCFHLSQQFRKLSMSHTNHEDKLQIRNVIYHAIKDTTSYLTYLLHGHL